jgi:hypothetical protein
LESRVLLSSVAFEAGSVYAAGSLARQIVTADLNGDGKSDLAVAEFAGSSVTVLLNRGDGTFGEGSNFATAGPLSTSITHGDFNGDGKEDLAVGMETQVGVFFGAGDGTFGPEVDYEVWSGTNYGAFSVTAGDFNGDGKLDLATDGTDNNVVLLMNQGDGTFDRVDYSRPMTNSVFRVQAADMNGDGRTDLVAYIASMALATPGVRVEVWMNDGSGGFNQAEYPLGDQRSQGPSSLTVEDLNGDGMPDVVAAMPDEQIVSVFMNNGDGTLAAKLDYGQLKLRQATVSDVNGDGKLDLLTSALEDTISVRLNDGNGNFGPARSLCTGQERQGVPWTMASGDFNGDGAADLAVGLTNASTNSGALLVMLNANTTGTPTSLSLAQSAGQTLEQQAVVFAARVWTENAGAATGRVRFVVDGATLGTAPVINGVAVFKTTALKAGAAGHAVVAIYEGDAGHGGSISHQVAHEVKARPRVAPHPVAGQVNVPLAMGWVDSLNGRVVKGWAAGPAVAVTVDGRYVGVAAAKEMRSGLGRHGFRFTLPVLATGRHVVRVFGVDVRTGRLVLLGGKVIG